MNDWHQESPEQVTASSEWARVSRSLWYPSWLVVLLVAVKWLDIALKLHLAEYAIYPRTLHGLFGVLITPLVHADFHHLVSNAIPLLVLGSVLCYFYREVALRVFFFSYLFSGLMVWVFARPSYHIGASGLVYAFASFLFFSGIVRKYAPLITISLLVVFLYGYLIWGVFPIDPLVSWEGHLWGGICGGVLAFVFRAEGPNFKPPVWDDDEEDSDSSSPFFESSEGEQESNKPL